MDGAACVSRRVGFGVSLVRVLVHECVHAFACKLNAAATSREQQMESVPLVIPAPMPDKGGPMREVNHVFM